jgi:hypothetical protein
VRTQGKGKGLICKPPLPRSSSQPSSCHSTATSPANQPQWPGTKAVHEDPQRQGGGTEQKGSNGEAQIEHIVLLVTAWPLVLPILGGIGPVLS